MKKVISFTEKFSLVQFLAKNKEIIEGQGLSKVAVQKMVKEAGLAEITTAATWDEIVTTSGVTIRDGRKSDGGQIGKLTKLAPRVDALEAALEVEKTTRIDLVARLEALETFVRTVSERVCGG